MRRKQEKVQHAFSQPNGRRRFFSTLAGILSAAGAEGSGPVDATFKAIEAVVNSGTQLLLYSVNNITSGTDSQGEVTVRLEQAGRIVNGNGADTDIVIASAKVYLNALNKLIAASARAHPQAGTPI